MSNKDLVTHWGLGTERLKSIYGKLTYREWCLKEKERINERGLRQVHLVEKDDGRVALSK